MLLSSRTNPTLVCGILAVWTWSMLQFPLDLAGKSIHIYTKKQKSTTLKYKPHEHEGGSVTSYCNLEGR